MKLKPHQENGLRVCLARTSCSSLCVFTIATVSQTMGNDKTLLGDRQKAYELHEAGRKLLPLLPIMIRLDGRGFSRWTKGLQRPFDPALAEVMRQTTKLLVEEFGATLGYTQSDEISLVLVPGTYDDKLIFNSRVQKLVSVSASVCTAYFNREVSKVPTLAKAAKKLAHFDSRVWNVPSLEEASNAILWRERDATKNAITLAASEEFTHSELHKKNSLDKLRMMKSNPWTKYGKHFMHGSFVRRVTTTTKFTAEDIAKLPPKHRAHTEPDLEVTRSKVEFFDPDLMTIKNKVDVLFHGAEAVHFS